MNPHVYAKEAEKCKSIISEENYKKNKEFQESIDINTFNYELIPPTINDDVPVHQ